MYVRRNSCCVIEQYYACARGSVSISNSYTGVRYEYSILVTNY